MTKWVLSKDEWSPLKKILYYVLEHVNYLEKKNHMTISTELEQALNKTKQPFLMNKIILRKVMQGVSLCMTETALEVLSLNKINLILSVED